VYDNKEELKKNHIDITMNDLDTALETDKKEVNKIDNIDYEIDDNIIQNSEANDGIISEINFSAKVDSDKTKSIKKLLSEGLTEEQICHELSVSKGEVLLVKGLFKK
jgi:DNA-binding NarL/FixJ family response regulator